MNVAADAASSGPPWLVVASLVATLLVGLIAARAPVWLEKAKARFGKAPKELPTTPAEKAATGEAILREWLEETRDERDTALRKVDQLEHRVHQLTVELQRLGWDGRTS